MGRMKEFLIASGLIGGGITYMTDGQGEQRHDEKNNPHWSGKSNDEYEPNSLPPLPALENDENSLNHRPLHPIDREMLEDMERIESFRVSQEQERSKPENAQRKKRFDEIEESFYPLNDGWSVYDSQDMWAHTIFVQKENGSLHFTLTVLEDDEYRIDYSYSDWGNKSRAVYVNSVKEVLNRIDTITKELLKK